jgi:NADPH:quinone reductase-like Zn-dependent oxidoreductase
MQAIVWTKYGPPEVLQSEDVEKPIPKSNEVLIKVRATTVAAGDCEMRGLQMAWLMSLAIRAYVGFSKPTRMKILGQELAGEIESIGADVTKFRTGDRVFAAVGLSIGTYAEYLCFPEEPTVGAIALKPANMTFEEAAAVPLGGLEALHFIRACDVKRGQKLLIIGAGGSIGTYAVQLAKLLEAEVTAVDRAEKLELLRSIGADEVLDFEREDFSIRGAVYDSIIDIVGKSPLSRGIRSLKKGGIYFYSNPGIAGAIKARLISLASKKKVLFGSAIQKTEDLVFLKALLEAGKIRPVIDRIYPLDRAAEAHRYVETGNKKGNVILSVSV